MSRRGKWWLAFATSSFAGYLAVWVVVVATSHMIDVFWPAAAGTRGGRDDADYDAFMMTWLVFWGSTLSYPPAALLGVPVVWLLERLGRRGLIHYIGGGVVIGIAMTCILAYLVVLRWPGEAIPPLGVWLIVVGSLSFGIVGMTIAWCVVFRMGDRAGQYGERRTGSRE